MAQVVKDALVGALEGARDGYMKDYLANCLNEKNVLDESIFKRKRGRPKKTDKSEGLSDLPQERFARAAMLKEKKAKARMQDRLNPGSTREEKKRIEINADLREICWDLEETPGTLDDFKEMDAELAVLRREVGMKDDGEPFEQLDRFMELAKAFKEKKEDAVTYYNRAKEYLAKSDFRKAEELVAYLKPKAAEIEKKYDEVYEAYDAVCTALCEMADRDRRGRGAANPGAFEAEKNGIGMIDGEDFAMFAKRMRSLGLGREIPKTAKDVDSIVESTERKWRSVAGLSQEEFTRVKVNWQKTIRPLLRKSMLASNLKTSGVNNALAYGLEFGDYDVAYGVLQPLNPFKPKVPFGVQYGEIVVKWKPHCTVATMSLADGLAMGRNGHDYICASFVTNPSPCSFNPENYVLISRLRTGPLDISLEELCAMTETPYCELQLHGDGERYGADAVEEIHFPSEYEVCNLTLEALAAIGEYDIPMYVNGEQIKIENGEIVKVEEYNGDEGLGDDEPGVNEMPDGDRKGGGD